MNKRATFVLGFLAEKTAPAPAPTMANHYRTPPRNRTVSAFDVAAALIKAGHVAYGSQRGDPWRTPGAANTLAALRRRGLVAHDAAGIFESCRWWITPEGERARTER